MSVCISKNILDMKAESIVANLRAADVELVAIWSDTHTIDLHVDIVSVGRTGGVRPYSRAAGIVFGKAYYSLGELHHLAVAKVCSCTIRDSLDGHDWSILGV